MGSCCAALPQVDEVIQFTYTMRFRNMGLCCAALPQKDEMIKITNRVHLKIWVHAMLHCQVHEIVKGIFGKDPSRGVNPDEVVAMGAAIQGER